MKNLIRIILLLAFTTQIGCKKECFRPESCYDTIFPGPYFPVYPGSWWEYMENDTMLLFQSVSKAYQLHGTSGTCGEFPNLCGIDKVYVPYITLCNPNYCREFPVFEYFKTVDRGPIPGLELLPFLSEEIGARFQIEFIADTRFEYHPLEYAIVKDIYAEDQDSVLILEGSWWCDYGDNPCGSEISWRYYYKNLGLKYHYVIDTLTMDTVYKAELRDWYINK